MSDSVVFQIVARSISTARFFAALSLVAVWIFASPVLAQPPITSLAFSPRGDRLVIGSQDSLAIRTWPSLTEVVRHEFDLGQIQDLRFSPNEKHLLIAGGNPGEFGEWRLVDWPSLAVIASNRQHDDVIHSVAWYSDDQFVTASADHGAGIVSLVEPAIFRRRFTGHSRPVLCVESFASHGFIATAGVDQSIRVWDVTKNEAKPLRILDNHTGVVHDLAKRPGERPADASIPVLASAGTDRTIRLWQPTIGRLVRFARLPVEPLAIAWTGDGKQIGVACTDGKLRIVDANTVQIEQTLDAIDGWAYALAVSRDGSFAVAGSDGSVVRVIAEPTSE